ALPPSLLRTFLRRYVYLFVYVPQIKYPFPWFYEDNRKFPRILVLAQNDRHKSSVPSQSTCRQRCKQLFHQSFFVLQTEPFGVPFRRAHSRTERRRYAQPRRTH